MRPFAMGRNLSTDSSQLSAEISTWLCSLPTFTHHSAVLFPRPESFLQICKYNNMTPSLMPLCPKRGIISYNVWFRLLHYTYLLGGVKLEDGAIDRHDLGPVVIHMLHLCQEVSSAEKPWTRGGFMGVGGGNFVFSFSKFTMLPLRVRSSRREVYMSFLWR